MDLLEIGRCVVQPAGGPAGRLSSRGSVRAQGCARTPAGTGVRTHIPRGL